MRLCVARVLGGWSLLGLLCGLLGLRVSEFGGLGAKFDAACFLIIFTTIAVFALSTFTPIPLAITATTFAILISSLASPVLTLLTLRILLSSVHLILVIILFSPLLTPFFLFLSATGLFFVILLGCLVCILHEVGLRQQEVDLHLVISTGKVVLLV